MVKKFILLAALSAVGGFVATSMFSNNQTEPRPVPAPVSTIGTETTVPFQSTPKPVQPVLEKIATSHPLATKKTVALTKPGTSYPEQMTSANTFAVSGKQYPLRHYKALITPDDPSATQWWVTQTGLPASWDYGTGVNTKIAIIDSGFALQHEEFVGRWLDNAGESGLTTNENITSPNCTNRGLTLDKSCNGIDDDANGFIDDFRGWDFDADEPSVQAGELNPSGSGVYHGTAVAGVAAATGNNGLGIAGVSWGAKILPLQGLSDDGNGNTLSISRAIRYAADRNVDVINLSLGSSLEDSYLRSAIQYALQKGVIVVAASGNDGCDCISYPARYPEVVAVGASNSTGAVTSFTSYGASLDVIAPGSGIKSPSWSQLAPTNAYGQNLAGTSFASPYIAGLLANARGKQPTATWGQLLNGLLQTADHRTQTPVIPRSNTIGFGFVKADGLMARTTVPYTQFQRYSFTLNAADVLSAPAAQECELNQFPTAPFYEIRQASRVYYSISELTASLQRTNGATVIQKGYTCTGLPTDQVNNLRVISPAREFSNSVDK